MDVNETLRMLRTMADGLIHESDSGASPERVAAIGDTLAELVQAMDQWLSRGGFLPTDWQR
jgi:hypothetical protein